MPRNLSHVLRNLTLLQVHAAGDGSHRVRDPGRTKKKTKTRSATTHGRLIGNVLPTTCALVFQDKDLDAIIATNGTVKDGRGGAAYSIHSTGTPGTIRWVMPVEGTPRHLTSYCTELIEILGTLLLLQ